MRCGGARPGARAARASRAARARGRSMATQAPFGRPLFGSRLFVFRGTHVVWCVATREQPKQQQPCMLCGRVLGARSLRYAHQPRRAGVAPPAAPPPCRPAAARLGPALRHERALGAAAPRRGFPGAAAAGAAPRCALAGSAEPPRRFLSVPQNHARRGPALPSALTSGLARVQASTVEGSAGGCSLTAEPHSARSPHPLCILTCVWARQTDL
ncbi:MAG: hypothetical protein J3K34DRAFT_424990 [Monoraphidium minutum]|nr:MAG: hypothetical protein J3K34DRAFT_424990 [Monoraphidium minutum]